MKGESITVKGVWKCKQCSKEFRYESDKRRHELSHVPQFECKQCCKKFTYLSALRRHEKTHERSGSVQCNQCGRHFRDEVLLKRHLRYSHKGTYKCEKCTATFSSELALRTHKKSHKPESERRFRCSFGCGKSFNFSHHLKHHEMTHTNTKQHFCQTCGKGFIQSHHLKTHEKTHEPKYWLPCTVSDCKKKFIDEYARKRHLATHRDTCNKGSSTDSSVTPKTSPSEDSQDGELHPSPGKISIYFSQNVIVKCKSTQEKEILNLPFIDYKSKDSENNIVLEKHIFNEEDNYLVDRENNFVDDGIKTCEAAIGSCLVSADPNIDQSCLCAQMSNFTGETDKEIVLTPNNETLNSKELSKSVHDDDEKFVSHSIHQGKRSLTKYNGEARRPRKQSIAIHSSGRHIIVECKSSTEQKAVKDTISNPLFTDYEHKDLQNNNTKDNYAFYGRDENHDDPEINSADPCNTAIRSCLVTKDLYKDDNRVRKSSPSEEDVLKSNNEILAINSVKNCSTEVSTVSTVVGLQQDFEISSYEIVLNKCESCECANICSISDKIACQRDAPNIECIPGGIVKLKDTFDFDFNARVKDDTDADEINSKISDCESSNFKSCKDVIGNCIVSGNSTMGEGCLCARMMVDDQAMPEEIDEITPCPPRTAA